ncbi:hypothetical protein F5144DRAFT_191244 [Chaetomium tenue]|uniref:Uncharacterized protein n=1 Tax=Chaetomium tenue TaxID=1854479 RepID=A0ACB7PI56_9PEZI|nr:hypothetical protein F5144DRAFT_191244 [Chaetomium globosum]
MAFFKYHIASAKCHGGVSRPFAPRHKTNVPRKYSPHLPLPFIAPQSPSRDGKVLLRCAIGERLPSFAVVVPSSDSRAQLCTPITSSADEPMRCSVRSLAAHHCHSRCGLSWRGGVLKKVPGRKGIGFVSPTQLGQRKDPGRSFSSAFVFFEDSDRKGKTVWVAVHRGWAGCELAAVSHWTNGLPAACLPCSGTAAGLQMG